MQNRSSRRVPFDEDKQLCDGLVISTRQPQPKTDTGAPVAVIERRREAGGGERRAADDCLPSAPRVQLGDPCIGTYLASELLTEDLDRLAPHLWLMATQDSASISPLTDQLVSGRRIVLTENPGLHLVWKADRVFVKPVPEYLLSHAFWDFYLLSPASPIEASLRADLLRAALGFLRTYNYLVRHPSDFALATRDDARLLPAGATFGSFTRFIQSLDAVDDGQVSPRYHFGQLRLSRLNFWAKIFLFRFAYRRTDWQYGGYFARFFGPILFVFAVFSVLLSAMQVVLAAQPLLESGAETGSWAVFARVSRGFSVFTVASAAAISVALLLVLLVMLCREWAFAFRDLYRKSRLNKSKLLGESDDVSVQGQ